MITAIALWLVARRRKRAINLARETFAKLGHDLSDLSDDDIENGLRAVSNNLSHLGFSFVEAHEAMRSLGGPSR